MGLQNLLTFWGDVFSSESLFLFCISTASFSNVTQLCFFTPKAFNSIREYLFVFRSSYLWRFFWKFNLNIAALLGHYFLSSVCWQWKVCPFPSSFSEGTGSTSKECLFSFIPHRIPIYLSIFHLSLCSFAGTFLLRWMRGDNDCIMAYVLICFSFFTFLFLMLHFFFVWKEYILKNLKI